MAFLYGIDEAGYGPILGPLAVSYTGFRIPDEIIAEDLWEILKNAAGKNKRALRGRLLITDSKKAYSRKSGIAHLLKTVLALTALRPASSRDLIDSLTSSSLKKPADYPWYEGLRAESLDYDIDDVNISGEVFSRECGKNYIEYIGAGSELLDAGAYNDLILSVQNKSSLLFTLLCRLIAIIAENHPKETIQIIADRQGGRAHYSRPLAKMFPYMEVAVLKESENISSYLLQGSSEIKIHFTAKADQRFLPVSAASMICKLLREIMVESLNKYFIARKPGLAPTAGYWKDGLRFISEIEPIIEQQQIDRTRLVRSR
ncbi:ribonuclease H family protein [Sedimentisphaera salicampi]|uniref:hypothetical protein n=1 Tax=Sedimentisphaera salicampi TaxID=1941349 RepID=UPI000B9AAA39|nr:hypothetical protein [Sedimentisphaera salicampi]OXU16101.1 ribonuclease HII [Sedimentisphaera salicampi]